MSDKFTVAHLTKDVHIIDNLKAKLLLEINIIDLESIFTDVINKIIIIDSCQDMTVTLFITLKSNERTCEIVRFNNRMIIESHSLL